MLITVLVAGGVGRIFNRSLYERALRAKQIPLLRNHVPRSQEDTTAFQIMASPVLYIEGIISVEYLVDIL